MATADLAGQLSVKDLAERLKSFVNGDAEVANRLNGPIDPGNDSDHGDDDSDAAD